jgi:lactate permease
MTQAAAAALAALPIGLILVLMVGARWPAGRAGVTGLVATLLLAWLGFGLGTRVYPDLGPLSAASGTLMEALFTTATILWILLPALSIYNLQSRTGGLDVLQGAVGRLTADPRMLAILVGWFFALFLEGAAGFGTPVALAAPFLVAAGFGRVEAVSLVLIGHAVGVSFGAVGTPVLPQIAVTPFTALEISRSTGNYHALLGWIMPLFLALIVSRALPRGAGGWRSLTLWALLAGSFFAVPFFVFSRWVGPELPTLAGSLVGMIVFVLVLSRLGRRRLGETATEEEPLPGRSVLRAGSPYLVLVGFVLLTRLIAPVRDGLQAISWEWNHLGEFGGSVMPAYHPGTALLVGLLAGAAIQRAPVRALGGAILTSGHQLLPVAVALAAMLGLSRLMVHAEMIESLAAAAATIGPAWPVLAPLVGVLGTFVTGSATASNILFTDFQQATADSVGLPALPLIGAQGFGAAVGNLICPHNIIAGAATVGLSGREGEILRRTLLPCVVYAMLGGGLAFLLTR